MRCSSLEKLRMPQSITLWLKMFWGLTSTSILRSVRSISSVISSSRREANNLRICENISSLVSPAKFFSENSALSIIALHASLRTMYDIPPRFFAILTILFCAKVSRYCRKLINSMLVHPMKRAKSSSSHVWNPLLFSNTHERIAASSGQMPSIFCT